MHKIGGAIFDVDGTLLDSMEVWHNSGARYLMSLGIEPEPGLGDKLFSMTSDTSADYLIRTYGLDKPREEVAKGILGEIRDFYFNEVQPKDGAVEFLDRLEEEGIPMSVATSTDYDFIEAAFNRLGLFHYFRGVISCIDLDTTKDEPKVFDQAALSMGVAPEDTWVFEDGLFAIETAVKAGYHTVAVYDDISMANWDDMRDIADDSVYRLDDFNELER